MGVKQLALGILNKAFDDICPIFENEPHHLREQKIKERSKTFKGNEKKTDEQWSILVEAVSSQAEKFKTERANIFRRILKKDNTSEISIKIMGILSEYRNKKYPDKESKTADIKIRDERIDELNQQRNSRTVREKFEKSKKVWQSYYDELEKITAYKEDLFYQKRSEKDQIRSTLEWFVNDYDKVVETCDVAGMPVLDCYLIVKDRLNKMNRECSEIDTIINEHQS